MLPNRDIEKAIFIVDLLSDLNQFVPQSSEDCQIFKLMVSFLQQIQALFNYESFILPKPLLYICEQNKFLVITETDIFQSN